MPSKMVTDRQKSAESVRAALTTHRDVMARGLAETLEDPTLAKSVESIVDRAGSRLGLATTAMVQADDANLRERSEDADAREALETAVAALREDVVSLRAAVSTVLGDAAVRTLGFSGTTPEDGVVLERLATAVVENLGKLTAPAYQVPGFTFDPAPWKTRIQANLEPVKKARGVLATELRQSEATQVAKDKAISAYDQSFSRIATLASALLQIGGESELAARVRPSSRRPGRTVEDAGPEPVPEG
jgi:hypothetical protein